MNWNNQNEVLEAVLGDRDALQYASDRLKNNKEVVKAAVEKLISIRIC